MTDLTERLKATGIAECAEWAKLTEAGTGGSCAECEAIADACIAALLDALGRAEHNYEEAQKDFVLAEAEVKRLTWMLGEALRSGFADGWGCVKSESEMLALLAARYEKAEANIDGWRGKWMDMKQQKERAEAEVERLRWMLDEVNPWYGEYSRAEWKADLAARYEKEHHGTA